MAEKFLNNASSTLVNSISDVATSIELHDGSSFNVGSGSFRVLIDSEIITIASVSGNTLTVAARGVESTVAQAHNANATCTAIVTAGGLIQGIADNASNINITPHNRALIANNSGAVTASAVTSTELGYVSGVTSAVQTQLDGKQPLEDQRLSTTNSPTFDTLTTTNNLFVGGEGWFGPLQINHDGSINANNSVGTSGQVLTNRGDNNAVEWADVPNIFNQSLNSTDSPTFAYETIANDLNVTGTATAAHFVGDGSGLTGVAHTLTAGDETASFSNNNAFVYVNGSGEIHDAPNITTDESGSLSVGSNLIVGGHINTDDGEIYSDGNGHLHARSIETVADPSSFDAGAITTDGAGNFVANTVSAATNLITSGTLTVGGSAGTDGQFLKNVSGNPAWVDPHLLTAGDATSGFSSQSMLYVDGSSNINSDNLITTDTAGNLTAKSLTITTDGIGATGTISATAFVGDGSALTGITKTLDFVSTWAYDDNHGSAPEAGKVYYDGSNNLYLNTADGNGNDLTADFTRLSTDFATCFVVARNITEATLATGFGTVSITTGLATINVPTWTNNTLTVTNDDVIEFAITPNQNNQQLNTFNDVTFDSVASGGVTVNGQLALASGVVITDGSSSYGTAGQVLTSQGGSGGSIWANPHPLTASDLTSGFTNNNSFLYVNTSGFIANDPYAITDGSGRITAATVTSNGILSADANVINSDGSGGLTVSSLVSTGANGIKVVNGATPKFQVDYNGTIYDSTGYNGSTGQVLISQGSGSGAIWANNPAGLLPYLTWIFDIAEDGNTNHPASGHVKFNSSGAFAFPNVNYFYVSITDHNSMAVSVMLDAALNSSSYGQGGLVYIFNGDGSKRVVYRYSGGGANYGDAYYFNLTYSGDNGGGYFTDQEQIYMNWSIGSYNGSDGGVGAQGPQGFQGADSTVAGPQGPQGLPGPQGCGC